MSRSDGIDTTISGCAIIDRSLMDIERPDLISLYDSVVLALITSQYVKQ